MIMAMDNVNGFMEFVTSQYNAPLPVQGTEVEDEFKEVSNKNANAFRLGDAFDSIFKGLKSNGEGAVTWYEFGEDVNVAAGHESAKPHITYNTAAFNGRKKLNISKKMLNEIGLHVSVKHVGNNSHCWYGKDGWGPAVIAEELKNTSAKEKIEQALSQCSGRFDEKLNKLK
jgi:hypothetical protein